MGLAWKLDCYSEGIIKKQYEALLARSIIRSTSLKQTVIVPNTHNKELNAGL
jgi:hypothetical protein